MPWLSLSSANGHTNKHEVVVVVTRAAIGRCSSLSLAGLPSIGEAGWLRHLLLVKEGHPVEWGRHPRTLWRWWWKFSVDRYYLLDTRLQLAGNSSSFSPFSPSLVPSPSFISLLLLLLSPEVAKLFAYVRVSRTKVLLLEFYREEGEVATLIGLYFRLGRRNHPGMPTPPHDYLTQKGTNDRERYQLTVKNFVYWMGGLGLSFYKLSTISPPLIFPCLVDWAIHLIRARSSVITNSTSFIYFSTLMPQKAVVP